MYVKGTNLYIVPQYLYIVHGCFPKKFGYTQGIPIRVLSPSYILPPWWFTISQAYKLSLKKKKNLKSNELLESLCLWLILISPKPTIFMAFSAPLGFYWRTKPGHVVLAVAGATDLVLGLRSEGFARSTWRWRGSWKLGLKTRV